MSPAILGLIGFIILFALLTMGMPIGAGMGLVGFAGLWVLVSQNAAFAKLAIVPWQTVADYNLAVLPLFVLMAQILFNTGIGASLFNLASKWLGRLPGGIAIASVAGCAGFATVSATTIGTIATVGTVALPEMKKHGYDMGLATGAVMAGGPLGILIPPSNMFILYGVLTETSIAALFIGGIVPGMLLALFYMVTIIISVKRNPALAPSAPHATWRERFGAFGQCGEIIVLIALLVGGLMLGWFTPTEAGAVGAFAAIVITLARKQLNWVKFKKAIVETLKTTGMVYGILIGAFIFNYFLANTNMPMELAAWVGGLQVTPLVVMIAIIAIYILLGTIMDEAAMFILTLPVFFPLVTSIGYDAIWFGIMVTRLVMVGMVSPPLGVSIYVVSGLVPEVPTSKLFKGIIPFLIADAFHVALILFVPAVVLFLPALMK